MIGKVRTGKSPLGVLGYCLEDKRELTRDQKEEMSLRDGLQHSSRAEVLVYHGCGGTKEELAGQFGDVKVHNRRVKNSVFHLTLRPAPGDRLNPNQFREIGEACVKEFGLQDNQYLIVLHMDTQPPHLHIVANRVGYDGKVVSDSNSYQKMAEFCRKMEELYGLRKVLSPDKFLPKQQRHQPRTDQRKQQLKQAIAKALEGTTHYEEFERKMKALGYDLQKGRGITIIDAQKVRTKGSEVGYPLGKIREILDNNKRQQLKPLPTNQPKPNPTKPGERKDRHEGLSAQKDLADLPLVPGKKQESPMPENMGAMPAELSANQNKKKRKRRLRL